MQREIKALTSFRGIAAFLVLILHVRTLDQSTFVLDDYTDFFARGYLWVDFFFVLSGFILAYVYGARFAGAFSGADYRDFLRRRLLRIYPLHLATLLLFVPLIVKDFIQGDARATFPEFGTSFVHNLFLVQAWNVGGVSLWNPPAWSISAEWAAYLMFPLFFFLIYRTGWWIAGLLVGLGLVKLYVGSLYHPTRSLDIYEDYGVLRCFAGFCLGILVFRGYEALQKTAGESNFLVHDRTALLAIALVVVLLHAPVHDIWLLPAFALLVLAAGFNRGRVRRVLETPPLHGLGLISYSVYMTHWFVLMLAMGVSSRVFGGDPSPFVINALKISVVAGTLVLSVVTYRWIERPFRRWPPRLPVRQNGREALPRRLARLWAG